MGIVKYRFTSTTLTWVSIHVLYTLNDLASYSREDGRTSNIFNTCITLMHFQSHVCT
jgi:hypothetical protein